MSCPSCGRDDVEGLPACPGCGAVLAASTTVVVTPNLRPGELFHGRFEILDPLGQGGMGIVYKARDRSLDEVVAIKVLRPDFARDALMAQRFKSEIRLARRVRHRNVCGIHDFGEADGVLYISMEYVEGVDLKRVIRQQGALPVDRAYDVILQVAMGLQAVHDAGIIHRDLKTPNILLQPDGVARLMDFGIAKREDAEGGVTVTGQVVGTPEYMSPEQAQGHRIDGRTDIYSLGVVAYEVLTGRVPFRGETPISTILKHIHDPPPLHELPASQLSAPLREVLRRALAKDPASRYTTATAFAEAMRRTRLAPATRALEAATAVVTPPRRPTRRWQLGLLAAAVAIVVAFALWQRRGSPSGGTVSPPPAVAPTPRVDVPTAGAEPSPPAAPTELPRPKAAGRDTVPVVRSKREMPAVPARPPESPTSAPTAAPAQATGPGLLQIGVRPWAEVVVDGRVVGTTPLDKLTLPAGRHVVGLRHPAYQPVEREITVAEGQTARLLFDFAAEGVPLR